MVAPLILSKNEDPLPSLTCICYYKLECLPMWFLLELVVSLVLPSIYEAQLGSYIVTGYEKRDHNVHFLKFSF